MSTLGKLNNEIDAVVYTDLFQKCTKFENPVERELRTFSGDFILDMMNMQGLAITQDLSHMARTEAQLGTFRFFGDELIKHGTPNKVGDLSDCDRENLIKYVTLDPDADVVIASPRVYAMIQRVATNIGITEINRAGECDITPTEPTATMGNTKIFRDIFTTDEYITTLKNVKGPLLEFDVNVVNKLNPGTLDGDLNIMVTYENDLELGRFDINTTLFMK